MRRAGFLRCLAAPVIAAISVRSARLPTVEAVSIVPRFAYDEAVWSIYDPDRRLSVVRYRKPWESDWSKIRVPEYTGPRFQIGLPADAQITVDFR